MKRLKPEPLTAASFAPYGDVIECDDRTEKREINYGHTVCYHDLAALDLTAAGGRPILRIFQSSPLTQPVVLRVMERHPLSSQAFYPLDSEPYLVVVAERGAFDADKVKAFIASPEQGVNYRAGTWHHFNLTLNRPSRFLVIDRAGPDKNCDEVDIAIHAITIDL